MFISNRVSRVVLLATAVAGFVFGGSGWARADSFFDIFTELMADGQLRYDATSPTLYQGIQTEMVSMSLASSGNPQVDVQTLPDGTFHVDSFFDIEYRIDLDGGDDTNAAADSFFDVFTELSVAPRPLDPNKPDTQTFDTEMLSMNLTGGLRLASGRHRGHVTVLKISGPAGGGQDGFQVDSFFDIFTELSMDGGNNWAPCAGATHLESHTFVPNVPEPSAFAMLSILGVCLGGYAWRKRR